MADERRKDPRIPMRIEAEVKFTSWHVFSLIYTINISKGGMNVELDEEPKAGAAMVIRLALPDSPPFELEAVVKHAQPHGARWSVGVQFQNLDEPRRQAIEKAIRAHGGTLQGLQPRK